MKQQQEFYDTDILTENPPSDMYSDKDLPKEKIDKKKLILKQDLYRVYKYIKIGGTHYRKPAKYDEIKYRMITINEEQFNDANTDYKQLISVQMIQQCNIGYSKQEVWLDSILQTMKQDEITIVIQEYLKFDENQLKVLDRIEYSLIQAIEWTTIIDLDQDMAYLKRIEKQGKGNERCENKDELICIVLFYNYYKFQQIIVEIQIYYQGFQVYNYENHHAQVFDIYNSRNVWKILKTMKEQEKSICQIKDLNFRQLEDPSILKNFLENYQEKVDYEKTDYQWQVTINLKSMIKLDDIYGDGVLTKKTLKKGINTAKPDKVSEIIFNLWIYKSDGMNYDSLIPHESQLIYQSIKYLPTENINNDQQFLKYHIDDMKVSKLLRVCLLRSKKRELALFSCLQAKQMLKIGFDVDLILEQKGCIPNTIIYVINVIDFTEGKNNFTMNIDEKIEQCIRKRIYALEYIKKQNYEKALKIFKTINGYFDYGSFSEQDKLKMKEHQLSSLLNTSLCEYKLEKWDGLLLSTFKILDLSPFHPKAIYRRCMAFKQLSEYDKALNLLDQALLQTIEESFMNDLQKLRKQIIQKDQDYKSKQRRVFSKLFD